MVANTGKNRILKDLFWGLEEDAVDKITISLSFCAYQFRLLLEYNHKEMGTIIYKKDISLPWRFLHSCSSSLRCSTFLLEIE
jgi:hypothetical protein